MIRTATVDRLFAGLLLVLGLYIVWTAIEYGYMRAAVPGPGFFPFWVGLGLAGLSAANLVRSATGRTALDTRFDLATLYKALGILTAVTAFLLLAPWLGMLAGSALLVPAIAFAIRPRWTRRLAATVAALALAFPVIAYLLFAVYLRVPLMTGVFGF